MSTEKPKDLLDDLYAQYRNAVLPLLRKLDDIHGRRLLHCENEIRAIGDHISRCFLDGVKECEAVEELHGARSHMRRLTLDCYKELEMYYYDVARKFYEEPPEDMGKYLKAEEGFCTTFVTLDNGNFWKEFCEHREKAIDETILAKNAETISALNAYYHYEIMLGEYLSMEDLLDKYHEDLVKCRKKESEMRNSIFSEQKKLARIKNKWTTIIGTIICFTILQLIFYFFT